MSGYNVTDFTGFVDIKGRRTHYGILLSVVNYHRDPSSIARWATEFIPNRPSQGEEGAYWNICWNPLLYLLYAVSFYSKKTPDFSKDRTTTETALDHVFQQIQHPTGGALEISVTLLSYYSLTKVGLYDLTYTVPLHKFQIRLQYTCTKHMANST